MPEPLKNLFNEVMIGEMADHLARRGRFDRDGFVAQAVSGLAALELKQRAARITAALQTFLPPDFPAAVALMLAALHPETEADISAMKMDARGIRGWAVMPMADYVAQRGLEHFDLGLTALGEMTKRFSAEFAIRPFILRDQDRAMTRMRIWAEDPNPHPRRLASEGCRPRLPWGQRLPSFVADPAPVLRLLVGLRDDPSDYVRRSVANNLNDIAKDHPDRIAALAADWLRDAGPERRRLVRHACRGLVKRGHAPTLAALGYGPAAVRLEGLSVTTPLVRFGDSLKFEITLSSQASRAQEIVLDYAVHHRKANGGTAPKTFKWKLLVLPPGAALTLARRHPMRPITTRVYRDGTHAVEILANGVSLGTGTFELVGTGNAPSDQRVGTGVSPR